MDSLEQLACWAFDCDRTQLYMGDFRADDHGLRVFREALDSYSRGIPVQYITGKTEFMGLDFSVNPSVLIPRPETEILVEKVLMLIEKEKITNPYILDLGTGSGSIAVSLTKMNRLCRILASDISEEALEVAIDNASAHGVDDRIKFVLSDLFGSISLSEKFDIIVSNPPYIPSEDICSLPREVKSEPDMALDGGEGGLSFFRRIIPEAAKRLKSRGWLVLEMGFGQSRDVEAIARDTGTFVSPQIITDYCGIERIFFAKRT